MTDCLQLGSTNICLLRCRYSITKIARELGISSSSITRESKCKSQRCVRFTTLKQSKSMRMSVKSVLDAIDASSNTSRKRVYNTSARDSIHAGKYSGFLVQQGITVLYETIYKWIRQDKAEKVPLYPLSAQAQLSQTNGQKSH